MKSHSASSLFYSLLPSLPPHFLPHVYLFFCPILALFLPYLLISFLPVLHNLSFCTSSLCPYVLCLPLDFFLLYAAFLSQHPIYFFFSLHTSLFPSLIPPVLLLFPLCFLIPSFLSLHPHILLSLFLYSSFPSLPFHFLVYHIHHLPTSLFPS